MSEAKTIIVKVVLKKMETPEICLTFDSSDVDDIDGFLQEKLLIKRDSIKNILIKDSPITGLFRFSHNLLYITFRI